MHSVPLMKLFPSSIRGLIWNMSSQDRMISITSVLIPKTLVSANHSTTVKYTKKLCAEEEEEIRKIRKEKVWRINGIYSQDALILKGCNLSETTWPFQKVCNLSNGHGCSWKFQPFRTVISNGGKFKRESVLNKTGRADPSRVGTFRLIN